MVVVVVFPHGSALSGYNGHDVTIDQREGHREELDHVPGVGVGVGVGVVVMVLVLSRGVGVVMLS